VRQVLTNLISNAVKYTPAGNVTVRASIDTDRHHAQRWARVDVADTGPGLSESQTQQLFQEFHRLDTSRGIQGTGLGLAISKRIANALGGDIVVSSEAGAGSTFSFLLPCGDTPTQPLDTAA
jgi:signal transduction histidine kinase